MAKKKRPAISKIMDDIRALKPSPATRCDSVYSKSVYFNGKKLSGVQAINISYDIADVVTLVTVKFAIKRDSLQITKDKVSFEEVAHASKKSA